MKPLKILVGCEESQAVTIAFRNQGHEAFSCDIQDCSGGYPEWHITGDVLKVAYSGYWDLMIGHPPCTYLTYAGTAHWSKPGRLEKRLDALSFFAKMWEAPISKICLENPRGCASPAIAKYTQEIHPYYFGDPQTKATWLWLKNLPMLKHTVSDNLFESKTLVEVEHTMFYKTGAKAGKPISWTDCYAPGVDRQKLRSKTFPGIANAMAEQWGNNNNQ
jgi:hypothetical protein